MESRQNSSSKQEASGEAKLPKKGPKGRAVDKAAPAKDARARLTLTLTQTQTQTQTLTLTLTLTLTRTSRPQTQGGRTPD